MTRSLVSSVVLACSLILGLEFAAFGQTAAGVYAPPFNQTMTKQTQQVLNFYGRSNSAAVSLNQIPKRPTSPPTVPWSPRPTKPFTGGNLRPRGHPLPEPIPPGLRRFGAELLCIRPAANSATGIRPTATSRNTTPQPSGAGRFGQSGHCPSWQRRRADNRPRDTVYEHRRVL